MSNTKLKLEGMANNLLAVFRSLSLSVVGLATNVAIDWDKETVNNETISAWIESKPKLQAFSLDLADEEIVRFQTAWKMFLDYLGQQKVCACVDLTCFSDLDFMFSRFSLWLGDCLL